jgi:hypothetical protein
VSQRPILDKKLNRLRKAVRVPLPVNFDLVEYLKLHRHAQTTGAAERLILGGRVRNGSHVVGLTQVPVMQPDGQIKNEDAVERVQPAKLKDGLIVLDAA